MNEEKAREILSKHLGDAYVVFDDLIADDVNCYQFWAKEKEILDDGSVFPEVYGIDKDTGEVLDFAEVLRRKREKEADY